MKWLDLPENAGKTQNYTDEQVERVARNYGPPTLYDSTPGTLYELAGCLSEDLLAARNLLSQATSFQIGKQVVSLCSDGRWYTETQAAEIARLKTVIDDLQCEYPASFIAKDQSFTDGDKVDFERLFGNESVT